MRGMQTDGWAWKLEHTATGRKSRGPASINGCALPSRSRVLTWSAPTDESGTAAAYDLRVTKTAMTTEAELLAGTSLTVAPAPGAPGAK
jgi:hypothetical protein